MKITLEITPSYKPFHQLVFQKHLGGMAIRATHRGFSIIRGFGTYGAEKGLYEVMDPSGEVYGHLTPQQVEKMIN